MAMVLAKRIVKKRKKRRRSQRRHGIVKVFNRFEVKDILLTVNEQLHSKYIKVKERDILNDFYSTAVRLVDAPTTPPVVFDEEDY